MKKVKRFVPFRNKIWIMLFMIVYSTASFLGFFQYMNLKTTIEENFEDNRKLIHDRVLNMLKSADYINLLFEKPIEKEAKEILGQVKAYYESTGDLNMDLNDYLKGYKNHKLYIINSSNVVIATTDPVDLGLDFSGWTDFITYLNQVRADGVFSTNRVSLSINNGNLTKYCYLPSSDGKYIFETGTAIHESESYLDNMELNNFEKKLLEENNFIDSILLYDYQGVAYKKDSEGNNIQLLESNRVYFEQALQTMSTVRVTGTYQGKEAYYDYIPYDVMGASDVNERNVVEVIYNNQKVKDSLRYNLEIIVIVVISAAMAAAWLGSYMARRVTRPIEEITQGVKRVAEGDLSYEFQMQHNDEFTLLGINLTRCYMRFVIL